MDLKILGIKKAAIYIFKFRNINTILFHLFRGKDVNHYFKYNLDSSDRFAHDRFAPVKKHRKEAKQ